MYRAKSAEFYGIPGMKWGKRKKETLEDAKKKYGIKDEPSTAENLRRAAMASGTVGATIAGSALLFTPKGRKIGRLIKLIPRKLVEAGPSKTIKQVRRGIQNIYRKSTDQITDKILNQYTRTSNSLDTWKPSTTKVGRQMMAEANIPFSSPVAKTNRDMAIKREINMRRDHFTRWLKANTKPGELDVAEVNKSLKRRAGGAEKEMRNRFSNIKPNTSVSTLTKYDPGPSITEIDKLINDAAIAREGLQKIKGRRKKINKARRQEIARQYGEARNKKFGFSGSMLKVVNFSTAKKTNPGLWEQAKAQAKASMGGKHSARAMQKAVQIYKSKGGGYKGKKSGSNKLSKWTKEKWQYSSKKSKGKGRYRPKKVWDRLSQKEKDSLNQSKYKGTKEGKQFVSVPKKLRKKVQP